MALVVVAAILGVAGAPSKVLAGEKPPNPTRLWREFPLDPAGTDEPQNRRSDASKPAPPETVPAAAPSDANGNVGRTLAVIALVGGGAVALLLALQFARMATTTKGVSTMSNFRRRRSEGQPETPTEPRTGISSRLDEAMTSYTLDAGGRDVPSENETREPDPADVRAMSFDELGQTVANVLRSAQDNAAHVIAAARAQANSILEAAEAEAKEARAQLDAEIAERRSDSEKIRADANRYSEERRHQADVEANQVVADAEAHALRLREAGEATRRNLEEKGLARRQELIEASSAMEARLRDTLKTCKDVVVQIQDLLEDGHAEDAYEEVFARPREEAQEVGAELDEELLQEARETEKPKIARPEKQKA